MHPGVELHVDRHYSIESDRGRRQRSSKVLRVDGRSQIPLDHGRSRIERRLGEDMHRSREACIPEMEGLGHPRDADASGSAVQHRLGALGVAVAVGVALDHAHDLCAGGSLAQSLDVVGDGGRIDLDPHAMATGRHLVPTDMGHGFRLTASNRFDGGRKSLRNIARSHAGWPHALPGDRPRQAVHVGRRHRRRTRDPGSG